MLTRKDAEAAVQSRLDENDIDGGATVVIEATQEHDWGWVFFYESRQYLKSREPKDAFVGNAPFIVNRHTSEIVETGTAYPVEHYVQEYERRLSTSRMR